MKPGASKRHRRVGPVLGVAFALSACKFSDLPVIDDPDANPPVACEGNGPSPACPATDPICTNGTCSGVCSSDGQCSDRTDGATVCLQSLGDCVVCDDADVQAAPGTAEDECPSPAMAVCDATTHSCRACREHAECASGVCDEGSCIASADVIYMNAEGADVGDCLTPATGCRTLHYAKGKLVGGRRFVLMAPSQTLYFTRDTTDLIEFNGLAESAHIIGYGAQLRRRVADGPVMLVRRGANVRIEGLAVRSATGSASGIGIRCEDVDSVLDLHRVSIENNQYHGLSSSDCSVRLVRSRVANNRGGGVLISGGSFQIINNFIVGNGSLADSTYGGVRVSSTTGMNRIEFNTIAENLAVGASPDGVTCINTGLVVRNNIISGQATRPRTDLGTNCTFAYNTFTPDNAPTGTGNVTVADLTQFMFVSPTDFHVRAGSAATGKAQATGLVADTLIDYDGNPRQEGSTTVEVGADEIP